MRRRRYVSAQARTRLKHKPLVNRAFRELRKLGFVAKQSFSCCMGCAIGRLVHEVLDCRERGQEVQGVVYYHQQDAEYFEGTRGRLNLRFGHPSNKDQDTRAVANQILKVLKAAGIPASWNRKLNRCIEVDLDAIPESALAA